MRQARWLVVILVVFMMLSTLAMARVTVTLWFHSGRGEERDVLNDQVERFNAMQDEVFVNAVQLPEGSYNEQVQAAAFSGDLPDILDLDGPFLYNYAWNGYLLPLDDFMSPEMKADFLPSIINQGTYHDRIYALGTFDSGLAFWGNRKYLEMVQARIPTGVEDAWHFHEFMHIVEKLQALPEVRYALDFKMNYGRGEWFTYGFSPFFQMFGADLIDRDSYLTARGVLDGPEGIEAAKWFQSLFQKGYVNPNPPGDADFINGHTALCWVGHWEYNNHLNALGDDLVLIPAPRYRNHATGMGSWAWSITTLARNPEAAWKFLEFILQPEEIVKMSNANGAVPARFSASEISPIYQPGGPLSLFVDQLASIAVERPVTPAYPVITDAFAEMIDEITKGYDVESALDDAVRIIDQDIRDNEGYPMLF